MPSRSQNARYSRGVVAEEREHLGLLCDEVRTQAVEFPEAAFGAAATQGVKDLEHMLGFLGILQQAPDGS